MIGLASLLELALALSVVFAVWRIHGHVRAIREHFDRVDGVDDRERAKRLAEANAIALKRRAGATPDPSAPGSLGLRSIADIKAAAEKGGTHETRLPPLV